MQVYVVPVAHAYTTVRSRAKEDSVAPCRRDTTLLVCRERLGRDLSSSA